MPADDFIGPTTHVYVSQRLRLSYLDWGNPDAPPVILVHGGRDHARSWDWVARALRHDWHVIAPDLRGHGDSAWSPDGGYIVPHFVYDLAQLIHQQGFAKVRIVAHSLGGMIALRYAGLYPDLVERMVAIEGLGMAPRALLEVLGKPVAKRWRSWIDERRSLSGKLPRRYTTIEDAYARMRSENRYLSESQAWHLTRHAVSRNEDGTYSWKFDNYVRAHIPVDVTDAEQHELWAAITCPTLLLYGRDSWASNPATDGRAAHFTNATVVMFDDAGHWLHHDQFDLFMQTLRGFL